MTIRILQLLLLLLISHAVNGKVVYEPEKAQTLLKEAKVGERLNQLRQSATLAEDLDRLLSDSSLDILAKEFLLYHLSRTMADQSPNHEMRQLLRRLADYESQIYWSLSHVGRLKEVTAYPIAGTATAILYDWDLDAEVDRLLSDKSVALYQLQDYLAKSNTRRKDQVFGRLLKRLDEGEIQWLVEWSSNQPMRLSDRQLGELALLSRTEDLIERYRSRLLQADMADANLIRLLEQMESTPDVTTTKSNEQTQSLAQVWTYTETETGSNRIALGYPVPLPVESLQPVAGFRSFGSLHARHQQLMSAHEFISGSVVGQTIFDRDIWAYQISDTDNTTDDGFPVEGAVLQNGGIHAREWASPEVTTAIIERFADQVGDNWVYDYLVNNLNMVIVPVLNVDGYLQTQRYPNQTRQTSFFSDPIDWPRDGRMRRKNMRGVDEDLLTDGDSLAGVDLNRNHAPYWNTSNSSSSDGRSLVYHGQASGSEPESQALYAAAALGPAERLRMYIDTHSFSQLWYQPNTSSQRRNDIAAQLANRMRNATNNSYSVSPSPAGSGIGSTDGHFAETYQIPSYTLEIEPSSRGGVQYGGFDVTHSGFVLPESEIERVRTELTDASVIAWYMQAGPAAIKQLQVSRLDNGQVVYAGHWQAVDVGQREWQTTTNLGLENNVEYRVWVAYDKPMRWINPNGEVAGFPNVTMTLEPEFTIEGLDANNQAFSQTITGSVNDWLTESGGPGVGYLRYKSDAFMLNVTLNVNIPATSANLLALAFQNRDFAATINDANPASIVDYSVHWLNYEATDGTESDSGGIDRMIRIIDNGAPLYTDPDDFVATTPPPVIDDGAQNQSGGGFAGFLLITLLLYLGARFSMILRLPKG